MISLICEHLDLGLEGSCVCMCISVILGKNVNVERGREGKEHSYGRGEKHIPEDKGMRSTKKAEGEQRKEVRRNKN